ncbi:hypothetical protein BBJ29_004756 [Phytophthora kernoviae]|uniref:Uncharacterized protein n=1 Tax=Phytophthora kernoviae TaxID=325452 RepID=A0A3R7IZB3_9STRA|nr:hypothetical protein BBJ29_004756 [Phytophthora kernoviae]
MLDDATGQKSRSAKEEKKDKLTDFRRQAHNMKRERSPSIARLPSLKSGRINVYRPHQQHTAAQKRLRSRTRSSFSRSSVTHNGAPSSSSSNHRNSNSNSNSNTGSGGAPCQPTAATATPITPTSTTDAPPATLMQFAEFFVHPAVVSPSEVVGLTEEMAADFYSEVSIMYDMLSDIKTPTAEGRAVDELMRRMHHLLSTDTRPTTDGNASTQIANVRGIYNGLIRVFVFLYQRYYRAFVVLEVNELLAACWQRLLAFVMEYRILDDVFVRTVYNHVLQIVGSS